MNTRITAIVAVDDENGIGKDGKMAWHIPEDFKHFKEYTQNSLCIMGKTTFFDIASHKKSNEGELLPGRTCIVLSRNIEELRKNCNFTGVHFMSDGELLKDIIKLSAISPTTPLRKFDKVCIIGGKSIYKLFFDVTDEIIVTRVRGDYDCDIHMDLTPYIEVASTVTGWNLENTEHVIELYLLDHEQGELNED